MMQAELSCKLKIADNGCSECVDAALAAFLSGPAFWHFFLTLKRQEMESFSPWLHFGFFLLL